MALQLPPSWQDELWHQLTKRNAAESSHVPIIAEYRRLAQSTKALKLRNQALLTASRSIKPDSRGGVGGAVESAGDSNPVLKAYADSLEAQVSSLRNELSDVYKSQGQNTLKLLTLTEAIQEKESQLRGDQEEIRRLSEGETRWKRNTEEWTERLRMKDVDLINLQDEISALNLELTQVTIKLDDLKKDNGQLLQRWLDKMGQEVEDMNDRSGFAEGERKKEGFRLKTSGSGAGR